MAPMRDRLRHSFLGATGIAEARDAPEIRSINGRGWRLHDRGALLVDKLKITEDSETARPITLRNSTEARKRAQRSPSSVGGHLRSADTGRERHEATARTRDDRVGPDRCAHPRE